MSKVSFLDLGRQPIANGFLTEEQFDAEFFYNLSVGFDEETCLVTQMNYVKPEMMFNDTYAYRGSMSKTMVNHFAKFSEGIKNSLDWEPSVPARPPKVLEIGSNDGVFLKNWDKDTTFAVEPCSNFAEETNAMGYRTYSEFWDRNLAEKISIENGYMDLIFAANCICHIPDLDETFSAVASLLKPHGMFVFEDPSLASMINNNSYDQIYDEHSHVFSVMALSKILKRNGLEIVRADSLSVHGGSNRIWAQKIGHNTRPDIDRHLDYERVIGLDNIECFNRFAERVAQSKEDLRNMLTRCADQNKKVISYGATSKSTTVFNYCDTGTDLISCITDTTPEKQHKYSPGMHIPVIPQEDSDVFDYAFLGAWNFAEEIKKKELYFGGRFITHVPSVRIVE
jgi:SAM-dependent methyltransferase